MIGKLSIFIKYDKLRKLLNLVVSLGQNKTSLSPILSLIFKYKTIKFIVRSEDVVEFFSRMG